MSLAPEEAAAGPAALPIAALTDAGLGATTWEDLAVSLGTWSDARALAGVLDQLTAAGPAGPATACSDAAELVRARLQELSTGVPDRMLAATATIGLEFQDLDSLADLPGPDDPDPVTNVATAFCGSQSRWFATRDQENLEFVTNATWCRHELRETLAEMLRVYEQLAEDPDRTSRVGGTALRVSEMKSQAQPQYNVDIPMDRLGEFLADLGARAGMYDAFFGVASHFWRPGGPKGTLAEVAAIRAAAQAISDLPVSQLSFLAVDEDLGTIAVVRALLDLFALRAVHVTGFSTQVPKDQPILHKTNLAMTWQSLTAYGHLRPTGGDEAQADAATRIVDLLAGGPVPTLTGPASQSFRAYVLQVIKDDDSVWPRRNGPSETASSPHWPSLRRRPQVVIELRRVPVLPTRTWTDAAMQAFDYFVADPAGRFS